MNGAPSRKSILITGGSGFIQHQLYDLCAKQNLILKHE